MTDPLLKLPPGAYVVARPDGLAIVTIQVLGPVAALSDLRAVPVPMPGQVVEAAWERPALTAEASKPARTLADYNEQPKPPPVVCPECGGFFHRKGIAIHRSKAHGVPGRSESVV
jgi:alpha/beta superfamily hydrolase